MPFSIDNFTAILDEFQGVQKTSLFSVGITAPSSISSLYNITDMQTIQFLCMGAFVPAPEIQNAQVRRYGYGLSEDMPFNAAFTPRTFTFIGDGVGYILNFFRDWQRSIIEYCSENDINVPARSSPNIEQINSGFGFLPYFLNYKNGAKGYATSINILSYQPTGEGRVMDSVTLMEAFPINVEDQQMSWANFDQLTLIQVTFSFRDIMYDWTTRNIEYTLPTGFGTAGPASLFASIGTSISNLAATLSSLKF